MTLNLTKLRADVLKGLALTSGDMSPADVDSLLNRTYWEILEKFHIRETESATTFTTNQGQREYVLPPDFESLRISAIVDPNTMQHSKLDLFSVKEYEQVYNESEEEQAFPTKYFRANESIILWPTPDDTYDIVIHYRQTLADLATGNPDPALPRSWQELLIFGAIFRGWLELNDYERANAMKAHYIGMLNSMVPQESKEESDTSLAGLQLLGREY
jgi:hypothetical protein